MYLQSALGCSDLHIRAWWTAEPSPFSIPVQIRFQGVYSEGNSRKPVSPLGLVLSAAPALFSRVRTLRIANLSIESSRWTTLFERTPDVRDLRITDASGEFVDALSKLRKPSGSRRGRTMPLLPHLSSLHLTAVPFVWCNKDGQGKVLGGKLLDWAIMRCNYGVPIERMDIAECEEVFEKDVDRLREVVTDVEWDEWEGRDYSDEEEIEDEDELEYEDGMYWDYDDLYDIW